MDRPHLNTFFAADLIFVFLNFNIIPNINQLFFIQAIGDASIFHTEHDFFLETPTYKIQT